MSTKVEQIVHHSRTITQVIDLKEKLEHEYLRIFLIVTLKIYLIKNTYIPLMSGLILGAADYAIMPLVSDVFEPIDNEIAFYLGLSVLSIVSFYFGRGFYQP